MYRVLSLFAGIGGFDLGLERTGGFRTVAFCEIDPFCRKVLAKHWPDVPCYDDVRTLTAERLRADGIEVDCIVGGFPCQDISYAGRGAGLSGERSGLWHEYARLIGELRPDFAIVENVSALLTRGLGPVLGTLASLGYDAEWHCIPAAYVGAPHRRDRIWIVAHPDRGGLRGFGYSAASRSAGEAGGEAREQRLRADPQPSGQGLADASRELLHGRGGTGAQGWPEPANGDPAVADAISSGLEGRSEAGNADRSRQVAGQHALRCGGTARDQWATEPDVGRVAHGVPTRVDRLRSLGNAVVPQIPEMIGRAILEADEQRKAA